MTLIPEDFNAKMLASHGSRVEGWTQSLPELIARSEAQFGIKAEAPFNNLSFNYIAHGTNEAGKPIVLKLAFLKDELAQEMRTMNAYAGRGVVQVLALDEELGAAVLERAVPGTPLSTMLDDNKATVIFCEMLGQLRRPFEGEVGHFQTIRRWFEGIVRYRSRFSGDTEGPLPEHWVVRAEELLEEMIATTTETVLLHGDLHHQNILQQGDDGWAVIDPKGIVGDVHFETLQYLLNYKDRGGDYDTVLRRRVAIMTERLGLEHRRIALWGIVRGVLEACWSIEDGDENWQEGIDISERFAKLLD
ncbi:aminoglycoside phosphotransferase family protein [Paenibacillus sp. OV219]|uniref:aminoglycoside phosphotransferase family protein n=1 Tax=Paenibacillus sp. OV219 TaxID=1884377 RepID=UPI0008B992D1|nr:aminoglycoside phosphotransferase family protein [Paenibacillus sp. OV219]SEO14798.1 streptomycin 6-kinase [Paenibacillus sp. OV219]